MDQKDHAPAIPFSRSESLQHQNPYAHYRLKYESTYHPFLKKTKIFNSKVSRWFKLTEKGFVYSCTNKENHAQKIIPTNSFDISEARPLVKGSNFCVKLQRKKGSPYWIQCDTNEEKQFLLNYFTGGKPIIQANPSDISINNIISTREQPGIISEETSELPGQYFDELDPMLMNEEIAAELFKSEQPSVEKRVQMYQKAFVKIGIEGIQDKGARLKSFLADSSFDIVETEAGIGNNIPKLPCLKRVGAYYYRGISAPIYHADFEPLPKIMDEDSFDENGLFETFLRSEKKEKVKERDLRLKTSKSVAEVDNAGVDDYDDDELSDDGIGISHSVRQVQVKDLLLNPTSLLMQNRDSDGFLKAVRNMSNTSRKQARQGARSRSSLNNSCSQISHKNDKETCSTKDIKVGENKDHGATSLPSIKVEKMLFEPQEKIPDKDYNAHVRELDKSQIKSVEDCINAGHRLLWQYELGKARECFAMYRGESTLVELMDCECELHEVLVTGREQKVKQSLNRLLVILSRINKEAANIKEDSDKYIELELNRTEASLLKCVAYCFQSNKFQVVKAIADTWRGYRKIESLIKKRSVNHTVSSMDLHRYKFGHGVFALTFSSFSPALLKLIKLIGIKSDRAEGFKLLEECRKEKNIRSHYASLIVTLYKSEVLGALDDASDLIAKSLRDSHGSSLFYWVGSLVSWKYTRMHDSNLMLKAALACLGDDCSKAVYFKYELGLHYFLNGEWETALAIFTEIGSQTFSRAFIANHINEAQTLAKSMKVGIPVDFSQWQKDIEDVPDEERSIMPCPVQIAIKIACCYFNMDKRDLGMKWLFCIVLLYKKYSGIQTKGEEEFYHLTLKYIGKDTVKMLTYETYYFTKYLPKVPDENLENIIEDLNDYQQMLSGSFDMSKSNPALPDYISSILVNVVCNCLLGETELACEMYNSVKPLFNKLSEQYTYLIHHIEYWIGRALAEDGKVAEAKEMLKSSLKKKKCVLNIGSKVKQVLIELESQG